MITELGREHSKTSQSMNFPQMVPKIFRKSADLLLSLRNPPPTTLRPTFPLWKPQEPFNTKSTTLYPRYPSELSDNVVGSIIQKQRI